MSKKGKAVTVKIPADAKRAAKSIGKLTEKLYAAVYLEPNAAKAAKLFRDVYDATTEFEDFSYAIGDLIADANNEENN